MIKKAEINKKEIEKRFIDKWNRFISFESGNYEASDMFYIKDDCVLVVLDSFTGDFVKIKIYDDAHKKALINAEGIEKH